MMSEGYTTAAELAKKFFTLYKLSGDLLGGNPSPPGKQLHYDWCSFPTPHSQPHHQYLFTCSISSTLPTQAPALRHH